MTYLCCAVSWLETAMIYPQELFDLQEFYDILNLVFDKFQQNNRYKTQKS